MGTDSFIVDIEKGTRTPAYQGTHLIGGKFVSPQSSRYTNWEWDTCTVRNKDDPKKEIKIGKFDPAKEQKVSFESKRQFPFLEREHLFVRQDTADPYHVLTSPQRLTDAFPNMDKSPQILLWDRSMYVTVKYSVNYPFMNGNLQKSRRPGLHVGSVRHKYRQTTVQTAATQVRRENCRILRKSRLSIDNYGNLMPISRNRSLFAKNSKTCQLSTSRTATNCVLCQHSTPLTFTITRYAIVYTSIRK